MLSVGKKVKHSLTGECLTIKENHGNISTCWIEKPYYLPKTRILIDIAICNNKNLILCKDNQ